MIRIDKSSFLRKRRKIVQSIINTKRLLGLAAMVFLLLGTLGTLWALNSNYNRPKPLMDYVPQEVGIYDTMYFELNENDCRSCHGNSLAERHHGTHWAVTERQCTHCHEVVNGQGVVVERNCTTSGCHSWTDLEDNGWHHDTDMSGTSNCVTCHNPNLIDEITPIRDFEMYPPSVVTPTPFSCENCHWAQSRSSSGNPNDPGHPSTYDHFNAWGQLIGFYEYSKPIYGNSDTHHMDFLGNVASECYQCHSQNPSNPSWDPGNPLLIRYCERCHGPDSLHRIEQHASSFSFVNGWAAVGFHVGDHTNPAEVDPVEYKTWSGSGPYLPQIYPGFTNDEMCMGCHGDNVVDLAPTPPPSIPSIDNTSAGIQPSNGCCGAIVMLRGEYFGEEHEEGYSVQMEYDLNQWMEMPIHAWTDTLIEFEVPCWIIFEPGNYNVKVVTPTGESNIRVFTLEDCPSTLVLSPDKGTCDTWITISIVGEGSFGNAQTEIFADGFHGVHRMVDFVASQGTYTALNYQNWSSSSIDVHFYNFFEDLKNEGSQDPSLRNRNFVQDDGSSICLQEPTIAKCDCINIGKWAVYMKSIYFGDDDGSGDLSCGDTIFQLTTSDPLYFELVNTPKVYAVKPTRIDINSVLTVFGLNFGTLQDGGQLRIGSLAEAKSTTLGLGVLQNGITRWSNTLIKAKVKGPASWKGQFKYVWVEKNGLKSKELRMIRIMKSLTP